MKMRHSRSYGKILSKTEIQLFHSISDRFFEKVFGISPYETTDPFKKYILYVFATILK